MDNGSTKELNHTQVKELLRTGNSDTQPISRESIHSMLDSNVAYKENNTSTLDENEQANMELELEESIQKLVQNEVNVARASMYTQDGQPQEKKIVKYKKPIQKEDTNKKKTQKILLKKELYYVIGALVLIIICIAFILWNNSRKNSYGYLYKNAQNYEKNKKYEQAIESYQKALQCYKGDKADILYDIYDCYKEMDDVNQQQNILKEIISQGKQKEKAYIELAEIYDSASKGDEINQLISECQDDAIINKLKRFQPDKPMASQSSGVYYNELKVELTAADGCEIYYTLDGSIPTKDSNLYEESIHLKNGKTTMQVIAVDEKGVYSETASWEYELEEKAPDMPEIVQESGTYDFGQAIEVYKADGADILYYTLDGSTPTQQDDIYTEPVVLPEGNIIFSVIEVNPYGLVSLVSKRNFIIQPEKLFSFEEAKELLQNRMKQKGLLKADGKTQDDGVVNYVYQAKQTIDSIDIYNIRFDIKKDGHTTTAGYYGVGVKDGACYQISGGDTTLTLEGY